MYKIIASVVIDFQSPKIKVAKPMTRETEDNLLSAFPMSR